MPYTLKYIKSNPLHLKRNVKTLNYKEDKLNLKQLVYLSNVFFPTLKSLRTLKYIHLELKWLPISQVNISPLK